MIEVGFLLPLTPSKILPRQVTRQTGVTIP